MKMITFFVRVVVFASWHTFFKTLQYFLNISSLTRNWTGKEPLLILFSFTEINFNFFGYGLDHLVFLNFK